jgi:hypothetical protein
MKHILYLVFFIPILGLSQVYDDFSDGDFTSNPSWNGDTQQFIVNDDFQLQLNSEGESVSSLATAFAMTGETEWSFWIKQSFSPSANNNGRFYLASSQLDLKGPLNGYFLQFGESGSADAIELFRQQGEELTSICRGTEGFISTSFELNIRVRKDASGNWELGVDDSGSGAYEIQATGFDNAIATSAYLGVYCKYTASNATKFYYDDIYAGAYQIDTDPPVLEYVSVIPNTRLDVFFDEAVTINSATNLQNYSVNLGIGNPVAASRDNENSTLVHLTFSNSFPNGQTCMLTAENITDLAGNTSGPMTAEFAWFTPAAFEIQINEIMADPSPVVSLPDHEYLELFNRTNVEVDLDGWKLFIGNTEKSFENVSIRAGGFLILADDGAESELSIYGDFYGFSSFALTNSGQVLVLKDPSDAIIHSVHYTDEWYQDPAKEDGGWSLEQIDPDNPCGGMNNWMASLSQNGGTPGTVNSVLASNPDITPPKIDRVAILEMNLIQLYFSEPMDSTGLNNPNAYDIDRSIGNPISSTAVTPDYASVILSLGTELESGYIYAISVSDELSDCSGNYLDAAAGLEFGLPQAPNPGDVVINELLYNPKDDGLTGVDYVEIYNLSNKIIDLGQMVLATENEDNGEMESVKDISEDGYLMFPATYLVLTTKPTVVKQQYFTENPDGFIEMTSLPSYNNESGVVVIATRGLEIIDRLAYNDDMQLPLLNTTDGVALERVNYNRPTDDNTNWHSAAETYGFGTPAYLNSVYSESIQINNPITVEPEVFSPDNDGRDDVLNINYIFEYPGYTANIVIFDQVGRKTRQLVNNELLGTEGTISWDGFTDDNQKANIGIYIIFIEVFDVDGKVKNYKETAVLGGNL